MFPLEPGPFTLADPDSMRRLAPRASLTGIVADALGDSGGLRGALDGAAVDVTDRSPDGLDAAYARTLAPAADVVADQIAAAPASPIPQLLEQGNNADTLREGVQQYLPSPDAPITAKFTDPPATEAMGPSPTPHEGPDGGI